MRQTTKIIKLIKIAYKLSHKPLIVSAGMPRSGSTLLFNILREVLRVKWKGNLSCGWVGDIMELPKGNAFLIKTHNLSPIYRWRAQHIFYTYRDVRVATVSRQRMFNLPITLESIRSAIKEYEFAKKSCHSLIKYEKLIENPIPFIKNIGQILNIEVDFENLIRSTFEQKKPNTNSKYSKDTLLHQKHFTHTKDDEWRTIIPIELQKSINKEFSWWFSECGYPLN